MSTPTCPKCGDALLIVTNCPGGYLCRTCRAPVAGLDVEAWRTELAELRDSLFYLVGAALFAGGVA